MHQFCSHFSIISNLPSFIWATGLAKDVGFLNKTLSFVATKDKVLFKKPTSFAKPVAQIKEGRLLIIEKCEQNWCKITSEEFEGWIKTDNIWGLN